MIQTLSARYRSTAKTRNLKIKTERLRIDLRSTISALVVYLKNYAILTAKSKRDNPVMRFSSTTEFTDCSSILNLDPNANRNTVKTINV